jgi:hypothetical protein
MPSNNNNKKGSKTKNNLKLKNYQMPNLLFQAI